MIGRYKEKDELNSLYNSDRAHLVAVYGRRRVGKTYLIDQVFKGKVLMNREELLARELSPKMMIHKTLITTVGLKYNEYSSDFDNVIILDDLFK